MIGDVTYSVTCDAAAHKVRNFRGLALIFETGSVSEAQSIALRHERDHQRNDHRDAKIKAAVVQVFYVKEMPR